MGGRGASVTGKVIGGRGEEAKFYDKTSLYKDYSIRDFEEAIKDRKHEYIGVFDKNGKLIVAGTSFNNGKVVVPRVDGAYTITHNHPYNGGRAIGGTFSESDVLMLGIRGVNSVRATSNGKISRSKTEKTYVLRARKGADYDGLVKFANKLAATKKLEKTGKKTLNKVNKKVKNMSVEEKNRVYIGSMKKAYRKSKILDKLGFDYVEVSRKNKRK